MKYFTFLYSILLVVSSQADIALESGYYRDTTKNCFRQYVSSFNKDGKTESIQISIEFNGHFSGVDIDLTCIGETCTGYDILGHWQQLKMTGQRSYELAERPRWCEFEKFK